MKQKQISFNLNVFDHHKQLPQDLELLFKAAVNAKQQAYAPYSKYQVGAAVLLDNKVIVTGANQENASYPAGMCAERVALFYCGANYKNYTIKAIAIATNGSTKLSTPAAPCGICRQTLNEYEQKQNSPIQVIFGNVDQQIYSSARVSNLLPLAFGPSFLCDS